MKLVFVVLGFVLSTVSSSAWASGCDPSDGGSEILGTMEFPVSGTLNCIEGQRCKLQISYDVELTGSEISPVTGQKEVKGVIAKIVRLKEWGSCGANGETTSIEVQIDGIRYSKDLSFYSQYY